MSAPNQPFKRGIIVRLWVYYTSHCEHTLQQRAQFRAHAYKAAPMWVTIALLIYLAFAWGFVRFSAWLHAGRCANF